MSEPLTVGRLDTALNGLVDWERFAHHLGINTTNIEIIKVEKPKSVVAQKLALYTEWLNKNPEGTWEDIIDSLEKSKDNRLAEELKKKYVTTKTPPQEVPEVMLQESIVNELDKLQQSFIDLESNVEKGLNEAVECGKMSVSQLVNRTRKERAFTIPELRTVRTVDSFLEAIEPHYTFLNCHLLVCLALMLLDPIRAAANEYKKKVDALKKNTAIKCFQDMLQRYFSPAGKSNTTIQVVIKLEDTWGREKIWLVEELVKKLFDLRHPDECQWFRVKPGSVMAVFLAPKHMMMSMIVSASKRRGLMTLLGVNTISFGKCVTIAKTIEPFDLFTSLIYDVQNGYGTTKLLLKNVQIDLNQVIQPKNHSQIDYFPSQQFDEDTQMTEQFESFKDSIAHGLTIRLIPELESEVSSGHLTLESLVSCVNESIVCPIEGLTHVESVHELFQVIQPYYTFLNNHILQRLVLQVSGIYGPIVYKALLNVNEFKPGVTLFEIKKPLQNHLDDSNISPNMMKVTLTLNNTWQTAAMDTVEQIIQFLFNLKHPDELLWHRVRYGSVIIEFLAPKNMMMHLITNSVKQKQLMTLTGVMRLQIGNVVVHKTTQQFSLAESRDKSKNLQSTKAIAIYEAYVKNINTKLNVTVDENNNYSFESILTGAYMMLGSIYSDNSLVKLFLECGANPNSYNNSTGQTALMYASQVGNIKQIQILLSYGANINQQTVNGYTALMIAAYTGNIRTAKFLIAADADLYCFETEGLTAIHIAAKKGHTEIVKVLLNMATKKVDVNLCDAINERTCLHEAISSNSLGTVSLLLKNHVNVNVQDKLGFTPLSTAIIEGNLRIIDQLISANADTEIATHDHQLTPLHMACFKGYPQVVKKLLKANANKNAQDSGLKTPLIHAIDTDNIKVVEVLINEKVDLNLEFLGQTSPIIHASICGNAKIVQLLLEGGANLYSRNADGSTSLHMACQYGHLNVVDVLLKAMMNPDTPRDDGGTPLHIACHYGQKNIIERLLKARANINAKTKIEITPIYVATMCQHLAIVERLLQAGADPFIGDNKGMVPLHIAMSLQNIKLILLLSEAIKERKTNN